MDNLDLGQSQNSSEDSQDQLPKKNNLRAKQLKKIFTSVPIHIENQNN